MKLFYSPTSPFVRKVLVTAFETGMEPRIERIQVNPWEPGEQLTTVNPLGKVPALMTPSGMMLYDSPVICEYLDSLHGGAPLLPPSGDERWLVLRLQALADGFLDAAVLWRMESMRPDGERSTRWMTFQRDTVMRGLAELEKEAATWDPTVNLGRIAAACALGYLDFRFAGEEWRKNHPVLARWYEPMQARPSMQQTAPRG
jgi:glutathione S-transferase